MPVYLLGLASGIPNEVETFETVIARESRQAATLFLVNCTGPSVHGSSLDLTFWQPMRCN